MQSNWVKWVPTISYDVLLQSALPTYEEATRERTGFTSNRLQRPHWPSLGGRRSRNSPNPDGGYVTRQGSL